MNARIRAFFATLILSVLSALCLAPVPFGGGGGVFVTYGTAAPTITSVSSIGTNGGTAQILGTNFVGSVSSPPTAFVFLSGYPGPATTLSVTYISSSHINVTLVTGTYSVGVYTVQILDTDGQTILDSGSLQIIAQFTPATEFGANLVFDWIFANATLSGSNIVTVPDATANANTLNIVSAIAPTIRTNSPNFSQPNTTTGVFTGTNSTFLEHATMNIGGSPAAIYTFGAVYVTATGTAGLWTTLGSGASAVGANTNTTGFSFDPNGSESSIVPLNLGAIVMNGLNGTNNTFSINNAVSGSAASAIAAANTQPFYVGVRLSSSAYATFETPEIFGVNIVPTATNISHMNAYFNTKYGVTVAPGYSYSTPMAAATASAPLRIFNSNGLTNYYATTAVTLVQGSTQYSCVNEGVGTTTTGTIQYIDAECPSTPAGTSDLFLLNPDGTGQTYNNVINVTSASNPWTIFGFSIMAWYRMDQVTCSSSPCLSGSSGITSYLDLSGFQNVPVQATPANEPTWFSGIGDSTFNFFPYSSPNGTTDQLTYATLGWTSDSVVINGSAEVVLAIVNEPGSGVTTGAVLRAPNTANDFRAEIDNAKPVADYATITTAAFGTTISGTQNVEWDLPGGASPTLYVNVANGGSAVTNATTAPANNLFAGSQHMFFHSTNGANRSNAPITELLYLNSVPTSGQRTAWETYARTKGAP